MLWRFVNETIEDRDTRQLHQRGCTVLDAQARTEVHPAGSTVRRNGTPHECWACQPLVIPVLAPTRYALPIPARG
jgi:hypothetical protein